MSEAATLPATSSDSFDPPAAQYRAFVYRAVPRLLGALDRDAESPTVGSFDRDHWAWKFRDYPVNMLQSGLAPLALLYSLPTANNPYRRSPRLLTWLLAGIGETLKRQHASGSYDSVTPYSQDHGVTLFMVYTLTAVHRALGGDLPGDVARRMVEAVRRACRFATRSEEDYAFVSNHHALFTLAWQRAGALLGDATLQARGRGCADAVIAQQSPEGWYAEYGGPDPGYESLGICHLARYLTETGYEPLAESLRRSIEFLAHLVHPDGSVGGTYASRLTQLWYPAGFELLAADNPLALRVATFVRDRLALGNVVTPDTVDIHNLPTLLHAYLEAASACDDRSQLANRGVDAAPPHLPFESWPLLRQFDASGITVASTQHYFAVTNKARGGTVSVFDRASATLAYEDSGIVVSTDSETWSSAAPAKVESNNASTDAAIIRNIVRMGRTRNAPVTPLKFLVLRVLSLTLFRSIQIGKRIRRMIVAQLITERAEGPFTTERSIQFGPESIVIEDLVTRKGRAVVNKARATRGFQPFHMGSARYFHPRDLVPSVVESRDGARALNATGRWERRVVLGWTARGDFVVREDSSRASASGDA